MNSILKVLVGVFAISASAAQAEDVKNYLSFKGKASIEQLSKGQMSKTQRLGDRTQAPYFYKVNQVLPLVNSETSEDARSIQEQIAAKAYGFVKFSKIEIAAFDKLSKADQDQLLKFYTREDVEKNKGVVTTLFVSFSR